jgi:hypothetical protein
VSSASHSVLRCRHWSRRWLCGTYHFTYVALRIHKVVQESDNPSSLIPYHPIPSSKHHAPLHHSQAAEPAPRSAGSRRWAHQTAPHASSPAAPPPALGGPGGLATIWPRRNSPGQRTPAEANLEPLHNCQTAPHSMSNPCVTQSITRMASLICPINSSATSSSPSCSLLCKSSSQAARPSNPQMCSSCHRRQTE